MSEARRVAIVQSNYIPWRGYFDLIASVDEFILLDDVQYTKRDWRNRNRVKTDGGTRWLTIPVEVSGRYTQAISETRVADEGWPARHGDMLRQAYRGAPRFGELADFVQELYDSVPSAWLTDINRHFLERIARLLGIDTPLTSSATYAPEGVSTERLVDLCVKAGASEYLSGPAARAYLDEELFAAREISVGWFEYSDYAPYEQVHPPYEERVSIVDLLLCCGRESPDVARTRIGAAAR